MLILSSFAILSFYVELLKIYFVKKKRHESIQPATTTTTKIQHKRINMYCARLHIFSVNAINWI